MQIGSERIELLTCDDHYWSKHPEELRFRACPFSHLYVLMLPLKFGVLDFCVLSSNTLPAELRRSFLAYVLVSVVFTCWYLAKSLRFWIRRHALCLVVESIEYRVCYLWQAEQFREMAEDDVNNEYNCNLSGALETDFDGCHPLHCVESENISGVERLSLC